MTAIIDYRGKTPRKTSHGIPLITAKVVKGGRILTPDEFIAPEEYDSWMRRGMPMPGDVLVTTEAPLGEVAQLGSERVALAQRLIALRGHSDILDNGFLKFLMQSDAVQSQLHGRATGTTVVGIKQSELRKLTLTLPPIDEQRAIAHILGALDDKIELNRRSNETLEAMARALFKDWFVDFGPVRAKREGREPYLAPELWTLFPCALNDAGEPVGWRDGVLADIATSRNRGVLPSEVELETPYIGLEHMPRRSIALSEWESAGKVSSNKSRFNKGEILFGKLRPYFHKVGVAPIDGICSTDIIVLCPKIEAFSSFVTMCVSSVELVAYADQSSTGTKMPRTSWSIMGKYPIFIPDVKLAAAFHATCQPLIQKIQSNIFESQTLATLRDTLLPKLLSGELRVRDAERQMETVL